MDEQDHRPTHAIQRDPGQQKGERRHAAAESRDPEHQDQHQAPPKSAPAQTAGSCPKRAPAETDRSDRAEEAPLETPMV